MNNKIYTTQETINKLYKKLDEWVISNGNGYFKILKEINNELEKECGDVLSYNVKSFEKRYKDLKG